jgi:hypothetical protein
MANKLKETVDYFPFFVADGRTFYMLKKLYGAVGIGYFTELCRLLARTPGHVFHMRDGFDRERFLDFIGSKEHPVSEVEMFDFLDVLAKTGKIDPDLWLKKRLITSGDFLNSLSEAYRQRKGDRPTLEKVKEEYNSLPDIDYDPREDDTSGIITGISRNNNGNITEWPGQIKQKKTKEDKIKEAQDAPSAAAEPLQEPDDFYFLVKRRFEERQPLRVSKNGEKKPGFDNYGKEGKAIHGLIEKARARSPDSPGEFLEAMIQIFEALRRTDKFYKGQPFLPSALNSSGIWDRVLSEAQSRWEEESQAREFNPITEGIVF